MMVLLRCWNRGKVARVESKRPACEGVFVVCYLGSKGVDTRNDGVREWAQSGHVACGCLVAAGSEHGRLE